MMLLISLAITVGDAPRGLAAAVGLARLVHAGPLRLVIPLAFPGDPETYPGKDDVAGYLHTRPLDPCRIRHGAEVTAVREITGGYVVAVDHCERIGGR